MVFSKESLLEIKKCFSLYINKLCFGFLCTHARKSSEDQRCAFKTLSNIYDGDPVKHLQWRPYQTSTMMIFQTSMMGTFSKHLVAFSR